MHRGPRGSGIAVDPRRVRGARLEAGLSLAEVAGDDVSRTFIHFVERGISRPSRKVLALIARRTGKPISYFIAQPMSAEQPAMELSSELTQIARHVRKFINANALTDFELAAMKLVVLNLHQAAELTRSIQVSDRKTKPS